MYDSNMICLSVHVVKKYFSLGVSQALATTLRTYVLARGLISLYLAISEKGLRFSQAKTLRALVRIAAVIQTVFALSVVKLLKPCGVSIRPFHLSPQP